MPRSTHETASSDSRTRLIDAAAAAFYAHGYNVSMDAIAAQAGVARQTLYNNFSGKETLFIEVIRRDSERMMMALEDDGGDLRSRLIRFALAFRALVFSSRCIALYRTLIAEAVRFPEMIQAFHDSGPRRTLDELSQLFDNEIRAGRLQGDTADRDSSSSSDSGSAHFAADMLLSMLTGNERARHLLSLEHTLPVDELARVERIVDTFLRAFLPTGGAPAPGREK
ncbi:MAG: TetR/AcrR family transcriptional regulator [Sterolibacterium sp.]|jgi:TetR/AcrR family transcriptional repressor of mexJK operon|nr:TetR/AcrR family transcriptional regulator [Sterolibacterium sp.]